LGSYWFDGIGKGQEKVITFVMSIRPNVYAREYIEADSYYKSGSDLANLPTIPSTNSLELPHSQTHSDYYIVIPMVMEETIVRTGTTIDKDYNIKNTYLRKLARCVVEELSKLDNPPNYSLNSISGDDDLLKAIVFGKNFSKVKEFISGKPLEEWTFIKDI
jgi:hypothetical protein